MKKLILIALSGIFLLGSCKKKVTNTTTTSNIISDFVGDWSGNDNVSTYSLLINSNGNAYYEKNTGALSIDANGKAIISNSRLTVGTKFFTIVKKPAIDTTASNKWIMNLDNIIYTAWK